MTKKKAIFLLLIKYSLGITLFFLVVFYFLIWNHHNPLIIYSQFPLIVLLFPLCFFGLFYELKNYVYGGKLSFYHTFVIGGVCTLLILLFSISFQYIYLFNKPEVFQAYCDKTLEIISQGEKNAIEHLGESMASIEEKKNNLKTLDLSTWLQSEILKFSFLGLFFNFIFTIFYTRNKKKKSNDGS